MCFILFVAVAAVGGREDVVVSMARDDVEVGVKDFLSGCSTIVHGDITTVGVDRLDDGRTYLGSHFHHMAEYVGVAIKRVHKRSFRNDEGMTFADGVDIKKSDDLVVFVDKITRYLAFDNLSKDGICHTVLGY